MTRLENIFISGPVGTLDARLHNRSAAAASAPWTLVVCHPHPLYGGTMDNKVITTIAKAGVELGMQVLRFNYRGVGRSAGTFADAVGECEDLQAVIAWVKQQFPNLRLLLCGFSFGAYIAAKVASEIPDIKGLVTVAPAVLHYNFNGITKINCPWFLIQGSADEIVPPHSVYSFIEKTTQNIQRIDFADAGHFFHGRLIELKQTVKECFGTIIEGEVE